MYVVGAFDTVSETSQIQYCSVGGWNGDQFDKVGFTMCHSFGRMPLYILATFFHRSCHSKTHVNQINHIKVGEGLCPRGIDSSQAIIIKSVVLGNEGDMFVGGSFESRVWDGRRFVNVFHVAQFDGNLSIETYAT
jgi:hypothetical protein